MDVIEVHFSKLVEAVSDAKDLKTAETAHEACLAACVQHLFLDVPMFVTLLSKVIFQCKSFCASLQVRAQPQTQYCISSVLQAHISLCEVLHEQMLQTM